MERSPTSASAMNATHAGQRPAHWWAAPICHPLPLGAALLMAFNDHWLKGSELLPSLLTGKLSDMAGLFFFPALCLAVLQGLFAVIGSRLPRPRTWGLAIIALIGLGFCAANLWPAFNQWLGSWWGHKTMDPTDLWALLVLIPAWLWLRKQGEVSGE